ncbi:hypothetical protein V8G54_020797, partial [Vigna mungo]
TISTNQSSLTSLQPSTFTLHITYFINNNNIHFHQTSSSTTSILINQICFRLSFITINNNILLILLSCILHSSLLNLSTVVIINPSLCHENSNHHEYRNLRPLPFTLSYPHFKKKL